MWHREFRCKSTEISKKNILSPSSGAKSKQVVACFLLVTCLTCIYILKIAAETSSEVSLNFTRATGHHISEDISFLQINTRATYAVYVSNFDPSLSARKPTAKQRKLIRASACTRLTQPVATCLTGRLRGKTLCWRKVVLWSSPYLLQHKNACRKADRLRFWTSLWLHQREASWKRSNRSGLSVPDCTICVPAFQWIWTLFS